MDEFRLITLDPGHFHAALVQKEMYPGVSRRVAVYAPLGSDGKPGSWTEMTPVTAIRSITVNSLTPGTAYAFQMRALGRAGYTNWSDSVTRISM